jgi:hypothetical protein
MPKIGGKLLAKIEKIASDWLRGVTHLPPIGPIFTNILLKKVVKKEALP